MSMFRYNIPDYYLKDIKVPEEFVEFISRRHDDPKEIERHIEAERRWIAMEQMQHDAHWARELRTENIKAERANSLLFRVLRYFAGTL